MKNKILIKIQSVLSILNFYLLFGRMNVYAISVTTKDDFMEKFNAFVAEYTPVINVSLGLLLLTAMIVFIYNVVKLAQAADNPQARSQAIHNLLICGGCLAVQGSISIFIMLYFYLFN